MVIAVDGPAGAGKSTVCRLLAKELGYAYLDTGAMYRAVAWALSRDGIGPEEEIPVVSQALARLSIRFEIEKGALTIFHGERQLGEEIREPEITRMASAFSQLEPVRSFLTKRQRELAGKGNLVAEGRDMTTVVFPDARVKIYLTADHATRAKRRFLEYRQKGVQIDYNTLEAQIRSRDEADRERALSPLRPAPDALLLDTSQLEPSQVVIRILEIIEHRRMNDPGRDENY